jgi:phosphoserine phosphatase RsbU/P
MLLALGLLASILLIGVLDAATGPVPDLTVLYLVPIAAATVYLGLGSGITAVVVAFVVEVVPLLLAQTHSTTLVLFDGFAHLLVRGAGVVLIDRLVRQLRQITELKQQRDTDLEIAREVHESLFTEPPDAPSDFEVGHRLEFLREVGGDYYYFADLDDSFFFCLGDISGKGVAAALFTVALSQSIASSLRGSIDLADVVRRVNRRMTYALPNDRFVTLFACTFTETHLAYTIAGHERPLLLHRNEEPRVLEGAVTIPLGISLDADIPTDRIEFGPGDLLLAVTDGVTESPPFSEHPGLLLEVFAGQATRGAQAVCDRVVEILDEAAGIRDDVAVICIGRSTGSP